MVTILFSRYCGYNSIQSLLWLQQRSVVTVVTIVSSRYCGYNSVQSLLSLQQCSVVTVVTTVFSRYAFCQLTDPGSMSLSTRILTGFGSQSDHSQHKGKHHFLSFPSFLSFFFCVRTLFERIFKHPNLLVFNMSLWSRLL